MLTVLYYCCRYFCIMLNYLRNGNKFIIQFISIFVLGLLALKTGNLLFSIFPSKYQIVANMCIDTEETENDEHKEIDKPYSKLTCLIVNEKSDSPTVEQQKKTIRNRHRTLPILEHFGVIPSPPPDQQA